MCNSSHFYSPPVSRIYSHGYCSCTEADTSGFLLRGLVSSSSFCCCISCGTTSNLYVNGVASFMVLGKEERKAGEEEDFFFWHSSGDAEGKTASQVFQKNTKAFLTFPSQTRNCLFHIDPPEEARRAQSGRPTACFPTAPSVLPHRKDGFLGPPAVGPTLGHSLLGEAVSRDRGKNRNCPSRIMGGGGSRQPRLRVGVDETVAVTQKILR